MYWEEDIEAYRHFINRKSCDPKFQFQAGLTSVNSDLIKRTEEYYDGVAVYETLLECNGQSEKSDPLFFNEFWLMPEIQILEYIELSKEFHGVNHIGNGHKKIKNHIWNHSWFSLAIDGFGDQLCIDFDPTPSGSMGQIIKVAHDSEVKELLALSLKKFLEIVD